MSGWVRFHRKIEEWEWYTDPNTFRLFFHLVMKANHKDGKWKGKDVKRGQHITSISKLACALDLSDKKPDHCKSGHNITPDTLSNKLSEYKADNQTYYISVTSHEIELRSPIEGVLWIIVNDVVGYRADNGGFYML